jgi:SAM-dependent methyltransferase
LPSDDVVRVHGPAAARSRFACLLPFRPDPAPVLTFVLADGRRIEVADIRGPTAIADPYHQLVGSFFGGLHGRGRLDILELGSRARSNITRRHMLPADCVYTGVDIVAGENVDLVGDAHDLAAILPPAHFDVVFCMSVFEHLIMPWKAVLEVNRVLRPGGLFFITTHQCFPLHDTPWDFFRFSDRAWPGLFNDATGFRIRQTALGEPASVVAHMTHSVVAGLEAMPAYIASAVLAEKTAETDLRWPVAAAPLVQGWYPG